jgi:hypothetical protein
MVSSFLPGFGVGDLPYVPELIECFVDNMGCDHTSCWNVYLVLQEHGAPVSSLWQREHNSAAWTLTKVTRWQCQGFMSESLISGQLFGSLIIPLGDRTNARTEQLLSATDTSRTLRDYKHQACSM